MAAPSWKFGLAWLGFVPVILFVHSAYEYGTDSVPKR